MERVKIITQRREAKGKGAAKDLRSKGSVPAVLYSADTNLLLSVPPASLKSLRAAHFSESSVIDMEVEGEKKMESVPVFIKDIQLHPLTEEVIHIDFLKVSLEEKIKVPVPVILKGEPRGVKDAGGTLEQILREVEVEGLPLDIPEKIELDVSELSIGHSLHVSDLILSGQIKVITSPEAPIVTAVAKEEEKEEEAMAEEEAGPQEPEVIKEKKEEAAEGPPSKEEKGK